MLRTALTSARAADPDVHMRGLREARLLLGMLPPQNPQNTSSSAEEKKKSKNRQAQL